MAGFLSTTQGIIMVLLGLGIIIFLHELGHFIVARRLGIRIEIFSIGFGPAIWKIKRGGTEYRIALIPLGGFVKPAGEFMSSPDTKGMPDEMSSKPPLTRAKVLVAGALVNFIFAFPFCIIAYLAGINLPAPTVGAIKPGSTEANSPLQKGDTLLSVIRTSPDGNDAEYPIKSQSDYLREVVRTPVNTSLKVKVNRNPARLDPESIRGSGGNQEVIVSIIAKGSAGMGILPPSNIVHSAPKGSPAEAAGLKPNDEILEVNDQVTLSGSEIFSSLSQRAGLPTPIKIRNPDGAIKTVTATPKPYYDIDIEGIMPVILSSVKKGAAAENAGLKKNDRVIAIDDTRINSWNKLTEVIRASAGQELKLTVIREHWFSKDETLSLNVAVTPDKDGKGFIGIGPTISNEIGEAQDGSLLSGLGLAYGDRIIKATAPDKNGKILKIGISDLTDLQELINETNGIPVKITVLKASPDSSKQTFTITPTPTTKGDLGLGLRFKMVTIRYPLTSAIVEGAKETLDLGLLTYQMIKKLFQGEESVKGLAGPIGIVQVSYRMAQEGAGAFFWLLALISINLAILNLLPIPVLDGGTIVFCFIERIKGSPVSIKAQAIAQYAGLFILLLLVAFTFINDIQRILNL
ncbi:MAG: RIP metalloprotease RseP [Planctomycetota bacterium]